MMQEDEIDMNWYTKNKVNISWTWMCHPEYIKAKKLALEKFPCKWNDEKYLDENWWKRSKWIKEYCRQHNLYCSSNGLDYSWHCDTRPLNERPILTKIASLATGYEYNPIMDKLNFTILR